MFSALVWLYGMGYGDKGRLPSTQDGSSILLAMVGMQGRDRHRCCHSQGHGSSEKYPMFLGRVLLGTGSADSNVPSAFWGIAVVFPRHATSLCLFPLLLPP